MTAYSTTDISNKLVQENMDEAFNYGLIDAATRSAIKKAYPINLYTPNYFIRIGLGILTIIAGLFTCLLLGMLFESSSMGFISALLFFMAVVSYITLELLVNSKKYYNAGIDNTLLALTVIFVLAGSISFDIYDPNIMASGLCFMVCLWLCYRFIDAFTTILAYSFFFLYIYFVYTKLGNSAITTAPFIMMAVSAAVYFLMKRISETRKWLHHQYCAECIMVLTVISFYISGNHYIVSEGPSFLLPGIFENTTPGATTGWIFWVFTIGIPPAYLLYGVSRRSLLFTRIGILSLAALILTIRYYHTVIPADIALMIAGCLLIIVSYALIKYLRSEKYGYIFTPLFKTNKQSHDVEALIIAQTFGGEHTQSAQHGVEFGGGSSGGGGATGDF